MNATEKAKVLKQAGYIHTYSMKSDGVFYRWFAPDGTEFKAERRYLATDLAHQHYLAPAQQSPAPYFENPEMLDDYSGHDYAAHQAPAPVDILREKNERIAALEREVAKAKEALRWIATSSTDAVTWFAQEVLDNLSNPNISNDEIAKKYWLKQAPHAAPALVSLEAKETEWTDAHGTLYTLIGDAQPPLWTNAEGWFITLEKNGYLLQNPIADPESYHATLEEAINAAPVQAEAVTLSEDANGD